MSTWLELLAGSVMGFFGSVPVAGPVALVIVTRGLQGDFKGSFLLAAGAGVAEGLLAGLVFAGLGFASAELEWLAPFLDFVGVGVLVLIGAWFAIRGLSTEVGANEARISAEVSWVREVALGAGMVLGNPGMLGTWGGAVAVLEGTGLASASLGGAPSFGAGVCLGVIAWFWLVLQGIKRWRRALDGRWVDLSVRFVGLGLIALGVIAGARLLGGSGA